MEGSPTAQGSTSPSQLIQASAEAMEPLRITASISIAMTSLAQAQDYKKLVFQHKFVRLFASQLTSVFFYDNLFVLGVFYAQK